MDADKAADMAEISTAVSTETPSGMPGLPDMGRKMRAMMTMAVMYLNCMKDAPKF